MAAMGSSRRRATLAGSIKIVRSASFVDSEKWKWLVLRGRKLFAPEARQEGKITRAGLPIWLWRPSQGNTWGRIP